MSEQEGGLAIWAQSPETQSVMRAILNDRAKTFEAFMGKARVSSDPEVRGLAMSLFEQDKSLGFGGCKPLNVVVKNAR